MIHSNDDMICLLHINGLHGSLKPRAQSKRSDVAEKSSALVSPMTQNATDLTLGPLELGLSG